MPLANSGQGGARCHEFALNGAKQQLRQPFAEPVYLAKHAHLGVAGVGDIDEPGNETHVKDGKEPTADEPVAKRVPRNKENRRDVEESAGEEGRRIAGERELPVNVMKGVRQEGEDKEGKDHVGRRPNRREQAGDCSPEKGDESDGDQQRSICQVGRYRRGRELGHIPRDDVPFLGLMENKRDRDEPDDPAEGDRADLVQRHNFTIRLTRIRLPNRIDPLQSGHRRSAY